ncbi:expressed unknown protein [Seminavis robusta]|uniref:Uncharacterized protein n=1 Tax=Seminavis robusta TaxID=568900 RepID=A0A9N8EYU3_9STRA|nr:expressed unknown protein [Seminavis robusta]|eukprot:Sro1962_g308140.1 n/a (1153) ;mRNA; r:14017-17475
MASIFDFDDDQDLASPSSSPVVKKEVVRNASPPAIPKLETEEDETSPTSNSTTADTNDSTGTAADTTNDNNSNGSPARSRTACPILKGSRHARNRRRQQEEVEKQNLGLNSLSQDNNNKHVRFTKKRNGKSKKNQGSDDEDEANPSFSTPSIKIAPRRKKRKKPNNTNGTNGSTNNNNNTAGISKAKLTRPTSATRKSSADSNKTTKTASPADDFFKSPPPPCSMKSELSVADKLKRELKKLEKEQQKLSTSSPTVEVVSRRRIRGAGGDVFAAQDAGNHQMIHDECAYLTSTVLGYPTKSSKILKAPLIESVAELAALLSDTKVRRVLWQGDDKHKATVEDVLDVLQHTTSGLMEKTSTCRWRSLTQRLELVHPKGGGEEPQESANNQQQPSIVEAYYTGLLLDALTAIVSFLSWDVTIDSQASVFHKNSTGARAFRQTILNHEGALPAIMFIMRQNDPMVASILDPTDNNPMEEIPPQDLSQGSAKNNLSQLSEVSSIHSAGAADAAEDPTAGGRRKRRHNNLSQSSSEDNPEPPPNAEEPTRPHDPTIAGRRKRRRKKDRSLETIAEDGSVAMSLTGANVSGAATPPRSPPRVVFGNAAGGETEDGFSPSSRQSSRQSSPTAARRGGGDDASSLMSCDSALLKIHAQLGKARERFALPDQALRQPGSQILHNCQGHRELPLAFGGKDRAGCASSVALKALNRLLSGKEEGDKHSCLDESASESSKRLSQPDDFDSDDDDEDCGDSNTRSPVRRKPNAPEDDEALNDNPLLQTNRVLGSSGAVASLAEAMAETLTATIEEIEHRSFPTSCQACLQHLHGKLEALASLVDNACLLYDNNRIELSSASTETTELDDEKCQGGVLVASQVLFLKVWLRQKEQVNGKKPTPTTMELLNEMGHTVFTTLTSLTHLNSLAADQMGIQYRDNSDPLVDSLSKDGSWSGVQLLGQILYQTATNSDGNLTSKVAYDTCIFCLNALTNIVGDETTGNARRILLSMECLRGDKPIPFLTWLTQTLVGQTESFRDSIMKGSFGSNSAAGPNQHSQRVLTKNENEKLVIAGHGCVLLACLLMDAPDDAPGLKDATSSIRELILSEMPLNDENGLLSGTKFLKNTLRAFSNFIYSRIGDLSVAIIGPVRELITGLDKIKVEVVS